jgi:hypothetical protein
LRRTHQPAIDTTAQASPASRLRLISWFSIKVALAQKIAGKA